MRIEHVMVLGVLGCFGAMVVALGHMHDGQPFLQLPWYGWPGILLIALFFVAWGVGGLQASREKRKEREREGRCEPALIRAICHDKEAEVRCLVATEGVLARNKYDETALMRAAACPNPIILNLVLPGSDWSAQDHQGRCALDWAVQAKKWDNLEVVARHYPGATQAAKPSKGVQRQLERTLATAAQKRAAEAVRRLLRLYTDAAPNCGKGVWLAAAEANNLNVLAVLMEECSVDQVRAHAGVAFASAVFNRHWACADALSAWGDVDSWNAALIAAPAHALPQTLARFERKNIGATLGEFVVVAGRGSMDVSIAPSGLPQSRKAKRL